MKVVLGILAGASLLLVVRCQTAAQLECINLELSETERSAELLNLCAGVDRSDVSSKAGMLASFKLLRLEGMNNILVVLTSILAVHLPQLASSIAVENLSELVWA